MSVDDEGGLDPRVQRLIAATRQPPEVGEERRQRLWSRVAGDAEALERRSARRRTILMVSIAVAACALLVLGLRAVTRPGTSGSGELASGTAWETATLADVGVAVAAPGAELRWRTGEDGNVRVQQEAGRVFYRVSPEDVFEINTQAGTIEVLGTSFEVEVSEVKRDRVKSAALGAAVATAVVVTVYEGRVAFGNDQGRVEVAAGERMRAVEGRAPDRPQSRADLGRGGHRCGVE